MEGNVTVLRKEDLDEVLGSFRSEIKSEIEAAKPDLSGVATMEDIQKMLKPEVKEAEVVEKEEIAEHERTVGTMLDQVVGFEIAGIQVGKAVGGGFTAIFTSELVDGFAINQSANTRGFIKLAVGWGMVAFASRWLGKSFTGATALLLTFDAIRDLTPLDSWASQLADRITGQQPAAGLRGQTAQYDQTSGVVKQAQSVADSYSSIIRREG